MTLAGVPSVGKNSDLKYCCFLHMVYSQTEGKTRIAPVWLGLEAEKNFGLVVSAVVENTEASSPESATSVLQVQTIYMSIGLTTSELYIII